MKSSETEEPHLSLRSSPRKAGLMNKEDKDDEKLSSAEDAARPHIRCLRKHEVGYSDSDLTDNSSGEQGQVRAEKLHADGDNSDEDNDHSLYVFSDVVEITQPAVNGFNGPRKANGQKSEALTVTFFCS